MSENQIPTEDYPYTFSAATVEGFVERANVAAQSRIEAQDIDRVKELREATKLQQNLAAFCFGQTFGVDSPKVTPQMIEPDTLSDPGEQTPVVKVGQLRFLCGHFSTQEKTRLLVSCYECGEDNVAVPIRGYADLGMVLNNPTPRKCAKCAAKKPFKANISQLQEEARNAVANMVKGDTHAPIFLYLAESISAGLRGLQREASEQRAQLATIAGELSMFRESVEGYLGVDVIEDPDGAREVLELNNLCEKGQSEIIATAPNGREYFYVFDLDGELVATNDGRREALEAANKILADFEEERRQRSQD